jgi:hypothetical protein
MVYGYGQACVNFDLSAIGGAGQYALWMGPGYYGGQGPFPCSGDNQYQIYLDCLVFQAPANDECDGAIAVAIPSLTSGSTTNATHSGQQDCSVYSTAPDLWYSITGNGNTVTAKLCDNTPNPGYASFDTVLEVYCGGCAAFPNGSFCVTGNDDNCVGGTNSVASTVNFCTEPGQTYYIRVGGYYTYSGTFTLSVYDNGTACSPYPNCAPCGGCTDTEGEPNCGLPDTVNGGCNYSFYNPIFSPITCEVQVCGSGAFNGSWRDTDWFKIDWPTTGITKWTFTVQSMFDHLQGLIEGGGGTDCSGTTGYVNPYALGSWCQITQTIGQNSGPQWFFVAPQFTQIVACPTQYTALLHCEPYGACCMPDETCSQQTEADCTAMGGINWLGGYVACPSPMAPPPLTCNLPPVCNAGGPYSGECGAPIQLDGTGSYDPGGDGFTYFWTTDCPNGVFDDNEKARPKITLSGVTSTPFTCNIALTLVDSAGATSSCATTVTVTDNAAPVASAELNPVCFLCPQLVDPFAGCPGQHAQVKISCNDACDPNPIGSGALLNGVPVLDGEDVFIQVILGQDESGDINFGDETGDTGCPAKVFTGSVFTLESTCVDAAGNSATASDVYECETQGGGDEDDDVPGSGITRTR